MIDVTINFDRRDDPDLHDKLQHATEVLRSVLERNAPSGKAQWDLLPDQGPRGLRDLIRLTFRDGMTGDVESADFAPDELERDSVLRYHFHDLWFRLLGHQSRRHRQQFERSVSPEGGA